MPWCPSLCMVFCASHGHLYWRNLKSFLSTSFSCFASCYFSRFSCISHRYNCWKTCMTWLGILNLYVFSVTLWRLFPFTALHVCIPSWYIVTCLISDHQRIHKFSWLLIILWWLVYQRFTFLMPLGLTILNWTLFILLYIFKKLQCMFCQVDQPAQALWRQVPAKFFLLEFV